MGFQMPNESICNVPGFKLCAPRGAANALPQPQQDPLSQALALVAQSMRAGAGGAGYVAGGPPALPGLPPIADSPPDSKTSLEPEGSPTKKAKKDVDAMESHLESLLFGGPQKVKKDDDDEDEEEEKEVSAKKKKVHPKKVKTPTKAPKKAKASPAKSTKPGKVKLLLPYPGVPKKACDPIEFKEFMIYTDVKRSSWRVKRAGFRKDRGAVWAVDPVVARGKVNQILAGVIQIPKD
jgi:hypothetical protein